jgi:hypothetical protein
MTGRQWHDDGWGHWCESHLTLCVVEYPGRKLRGEQRWGLLVTSKGAGRRAGAASGGRND